MSNLTKVLGGEGGEKSNEEVLWLRHERLKSDYEKKRYEAILNVKVLPLGILSFQGDHFFASHVIQPCGGGPNISKPKEIVFVGVSSDIVVVQF